MNQQDLVRAIRKSGGGPNALGEADDLWARIDLLQQTGRYDLLLSQLVRTNNKSNLLALVLEANFAYQFESRDLQLTYEVKQNAQQKSSIDFLRRTPNEDSVFFELRLLQQARSITDLIRVQLQKSKVYRLVMGEQDEKDEVERIKNTILSKVQDKGKPTKFFSTAAGVVNIVVVDVAQSILGTVDAHDCLLATHGDPGVEEVYRRQVFGLFQDTHPGYPEHVQNLAKTYERIRNVLHGVLFLFKEPGTGLLAYRIEQYLMWNPVMITEVRAQSVYADLIKALPRRSEP